MVDTDSHALDKERDGPDRDDNVPHLFWIGARRSLTCYYYSVHFEATYSTTFPTKVGLKVSHTISLRFSISFLFLPLFFLFLFYSPPHALSLSHPVTLVSPSVSPCSSQFSTLSRFLFHPLYFNSPLFPPPLSPSPLYLLLSLLSVFSSIFFSVFSVLSRPVRFNKSILFIALMFCLSCINSTINSLSIASFISSWVSAHHRG